MKEIAKQFVIFGNFNVVNFENVLKLADLRSKYNLQMNAVPDIFVSGEQEQKGINGLQANVRVSMGVPESRPVLQSADKKFTIFFGTNRIHVEELENESDNFNIFYNKAEKIICEIIEKLDLKVNRVALNGNLFNDDNDWIKSTFNKIFLKNDLYSENSNEWQLHICSKEKNTTLGCEINKIATFTRGSFIDNYNKNQVGLIAGYDYNTQVNLDKIYSINEIKVFAEEANKYRELFI